MPSQDTVAKLYDNLDFTHAFEAFVHTFQGVNMAAIREGFLSIDVHTKFYFQAGRKFYQFF